MSTAALVIAGVWLSLCAVAQLIPRSSSVLDRLRWYLPEWRLFAPEPATADYYLCVRTKSGDGPPGSLVTLFEPRHRWRSAAWNPTGRRYKIIRDLMQALLDELSAGPSVSTALPDRIIFTDPYLLLLGACSHGQPSAMSVQFGILAADDAGQRLLLLSRWHHVAPATS